LKNAIQFALIYDSAMALDDAEADAFAAVPSAVTPGLRPGRYVRT
jgi:hypothetical protein